MAGIQIINFEALAKQFDFSKYHSVVDIGGALGVLCCQFVKHNPHMTAITCDLEPVRELAQKYIEDFGNKDKITAVALDFFKDEFPKGNVVTMGNILHDWDYDQKKKLLKKCYDSMQDGDIFISVEYIIDRERRANVEGLLCSLMMLLETKGGYDWSEADFEEMAFEVGFKKVEFLKLPEPASAAIAYK